METKKSKSGWSIEPELARIPPLVSEQERLETRRSELQTALGEMNALARYLTVAETDLLKFRNEWRDITYRIDEAEKLRDIAERVPALEQQRRDVETELREARVLLERLNERKKELKRSQENIAKLAGEMYTIDREMEAGLKAEELALRLPQLEEEERALFTESVNLKARIERDEEIIAQARGDISPLLAERTKEGQSLYQFFRSQVGSEREQLLAVDCKREALLVELKEAKAALRTATALAPLRVQRERHAQELRIEHRNAGRFQCEIVGTKINAQTCRHLEERMAQLEREMIVVREARAKFDKLDLLREWLEALKIEGREKREEVATLRQRLEQMAGLKEEMATIEEMYLAWQGIGRQDSKQATRHKIKKAPGTSLLALVDFLFSSKTVEETFKPLIADWRYEEFEALKQSRIKKARWISSRYRFAFACTFIKAMGLSKVFSLFKQLSK